MIRRLLTFAGRHGGRLAVVHHGDGLAIAVQTHPIELVVGLDRDQVAELVVLLADWLDDPAATVQRLNSRPGAGAGGAGEAPTGVNLG